MLAGRMEETAWSSWYYLDEDSQMSGILLKVREVSGKKSCQGKVA